MGERARHRRNGQAPTVIFIAGSGRSGSTLLERTLGAIPGYVNVGELIDLPRRVAPNAELCGCGVPFPDCPFWSVIGKRSFDDWSPALLAQMHQLQVRVARQRHLPRLLLPARTRTFQDDVRRYSEIYSTLYREVARQGGGRYVVDASKWPAQALALYRGGIDVRVIHLVRDVRGVAHSLNRTVTRPHSRSSPDLMFHESYAASAVRWLATQTEMDLLTRGALPVSPLHYADFVLDPRGSVHSVLRDLGAELDAHALDHIGPDVIQLGPSHGLSGNPSRFSHGHVHLRPDERWLHEMPRRHQLVTATIAVPQRRHFASPIWRRTAPAAGSEVPSACRSLAQSQLPLVTVVIPTHGRRALVREAVQAVVSQSYAGELECVIVHDQEVPDDSLTALSRPGRAVTVVVNTRTPGLAGARNTGVAQASGELIASCDDDDRWHPRKLEKQVHALIADPTLLAVGSGLRLLLPGGRVQDWAARGGYISYQHLLRNRVKELHSSTLLMHKDAFAKAGPYDETLPRGYAEDYDWILRAARVGRLAAVREPLADIRKDGGSYYQGQAARTAEALEEFLVRHPDIAASRRGHARILGQMALARAAMGDSRVARRYVLQGVGRWPLQPHPYMAALHVVVGVSPERIAALARRLRRGMA